jgi:HAE1 family hydrophobic/amphiphilic exporter-1
MFLADLSIRNKVFIAVISISLIVFGGLAYKSLGIALFPNADLPIVTVTAMYPGADPETIEKDVVEKIENAVSSISGIKHIQGFALNSVGQIVVTFADSVDIRIAAQDVRDKVATVQDDFPDDVETPIVGKVDFQAVPVLSIVVQAPPGEKLNELTRITEKYVKNQIQTLYGVGAVNMYGGRKREIKLLLDPVKMEGVNIPAYTFVQLLQGTFLNIPAGSMKLLGNSEDITVKSTSERNDVEKMRNTPIMNAGDSSIKVRDIAEVEDGLEEEESASYQDLNSTVALQIQKQGGVNVVKMADLVKKELEKIRKLLPEGYKIEIVSDSSPFIKRAIDSSVEDILVGSVLAVLIIFLFLRNIRASLIVATALPTSIVGTFFAIWALGYTLNYITTLALSLAIGLLVDDAIVIIENIYRHLEMGKTKVQAALDATKEIGFAVLAITLTIIAVFGPIVYMEGMVGKIMRQFGVTVSVAVAISLLISFTVTPLLSSLVLKEESKTFFLYRVMEFLLEKLENGYATAIRVVLKSPISKILVFLLGIAFFAVGISLAGKLKSNFMDKMDQGIFDVNIELQGEASLDQSKMVTREVVEIVSKKSWVDFTFSTVGNESKEKNKMVVRVKMKPLEQRKTTQMAAMDELREDLAFLRSDFDADFSVAEMNEFGGGNQAPIQFNILGPDYEEIRRDAAKLMAFMKKDGGFTDIINSDKGQKKELRVEIDHEKASKLGVSPMVISLALRQLFSGEKVANFKDKGDMYDIKVYLDTAYKNLESLRSLPLTTAPTGQIVKVDDVANITYGTQDVIINRLDRNRMITISGDYAVAKKTSLGEQVAKAEKFAKQNFSKKNKMTQGGEAEMMEESFSSLLVTVFISLFLIYAILASQFNSFIHPLTIMSAIPFAITGAFFSLWITGMSLSIMSAIGIIMLMGLVTKNSILLVDFAIDRIKQGLSAHDALEQAAKIRLRPILMTTLAIIFGMIPVVVASGEGAEIKHPMAWSVMGGVIFSTMVTLFIVPVIFSFFDMFRRKKKA